MEVEWCPEPFLASPAAASDPPKVRLQPPPMYPGLDPFELTAAGPATVPLERFPVEKAASGRVKPGMTTQHKYANFQLSEGKLAGLKPSTCQRLE